MKNASRQMALCGMMTALAVTVLCLGGLIPASTFCCPVLAGLTLIPSLQRCGQKQALVQYAASAILGILLGPDKEAAVLFLVLGYYPVFKPRIDRMKKPAGLLGKLALFNCAVILAYAVMIGLLRMDALTEEFRHDGLLFAGILLLAGNAVFLLYDRLLGKLTVLFERKFPQKT